MTFSTNSDHTCRTCGLPCDCGADVNDYMQDMAAEDCLDCSECVDGRQAQYMQDREVAQMFAGQQGYGEDW